MKSKSTNSFEMSGQYNNEFNDKIDYLNEKNYELELENKRLKDKIGSS